MRYMFHSAWLRLRYGVRPATGINVPGGVLISPRPLSASEVTRIKHAWRRHG